MVETRSSIMLRQEHVQCKQTRWMKSAPMLNITSPTSEDDEEAGTGKGRPKRPSRRWTRCTRGYDNNPNQFWVLSSAHKRGDWASPAPFAVTGLAWPGWPDMPHGGPLLLRLEEFRRDWKGFWRIGGATPVKRVTKTKADVDISTDEREDAVTAAAAASKGEGI